MYELRLHRLLVNLPPWASPIPPDSVVFEGHKKRNLQISIPAAKLQG
jgi:hypothetical protein